MPSGHAPRPDGFNSQFMKKCWRIIKDEFLRLLQQFYMGNVNLDFINGSFITLIPKKENPWTDNDYRPISLLNSLLKHLTKLMSTRLQSIITTVVHANQYGFIKGKNIQDCLAWAFQFLHICHKSKREIVILKLDFEKAFDMIEHEVIISMLRHKGFSEKWVSWVQAILSSSTFQVLLNGVPRKSFRCKRGVRQGDPLSPLLFVLAADLLQSIVNKAFWANILKHPLSKDFGQDYPIVQHADDTLVILPANAVQLWTLKGLLHSFADSTGLKVNYNKSFLVVINVENEKTTHLARTIGCQVVEMSFTYLGLPLGITRPAIEDFLPFLNRIERRMLGLNRLLSYQGRLILVNSILSALPTFYMCSLKMPISILDQADKYRKHNF
jgi:hypothetical protein